MIKIPHEKVFKLKERTEMSIFLRQIVYQKSFSPVYQETFIPDLIIKEILKRLRKADYPTGVIFEHEFWNQEVNCLVHFQASYDYTANSIKMEWNNVPTVVQIKEGIKEEIKEGIKEGMEDNTFV